MTNNTPNNPTLVELVEFLIKKINELDADFIINQSFSDEESKDELLSSFFLGMETNDLDYIIDIVRSKQARQIREKHERLHIIIGKLIAYFNVAEFLGLPMPKEYRLLIEKINQNLI